METNNYNSRPPGCGNPLRACLVVTGILMVLFIAGLMYIVRSSTIKSMAVCGANMQEVGAAIERYVDVNGHRPKDLRELEKDYLKQPSVLRCPLDKTPGDMSSYKYTDAKDDQVMLECDRHKMRRDMPASKLVVLGDGTFKAISPGIKETLKAAEKQAREQEKTHKP